jgi:N-hydroxyarylamine O-acetyltransferase
MLLESYFSRIGYTGPQSPTLDTLREIIFSHACSIPFENLDVLLNRGISLHDDSIDRKLIEHRRGGYCFEQNSLLLRVLTVLGFRVTPLSARVRLGFTRDQMPPRTHLFLRVEIDGTPWLVDVGVGSFSPTGPIRLDLLNSEQSIPHEPRRLVMVQRRSIPTYFHQAKSGEDWVDVCEFTGEEMPPIDRELANWWTSAHPLSRFRQNLLVSLACRDGSRLNLLNREFTHRTGHVILERFNLASPEQLNEILRDRFGLDFPSETRFDQPSWDLPRV